MVDYRQVDGLVTRGLIACTLGSSPGPTFGNKYGRTLPLPLPLPTLSAQLTTLTFEIRSIFRALYYLSTKLRVDSSSYFSFRARTHMHTNTYRRYHRLSYPRLRVLRFRTQTSTSGILVCFGKHFHLHLFGLHVPWHLNLTFKQCRHMTVKFAW